MISILIAVLIAFANGAHDVRTHQWGALNDDLQATVEYVGPDRCPTWDTATCVVTVGPDAPEKLLKALLRDALR